MVLLVILSICSLFIGVSRVEFMEIIRFEGQSMQLLLATRFPRTICLVLVGATSSICGLIMQHLTQNKFVSPTTAGTMDSARLGILVVMLFYRMLLCGFVQQLHFYLRLRYALYFYLLHDFFHKKSADVTIDRRDARKYYRLCCNIFAYQFQLVQNMSSWLQGNFATVMRGNYELLYVTIPLLLYLIFFCLSIYDRRFR